MRFWYQRIEKILSNGEVEGKKSRNAEVEEEIKIASKGDVEVEKEEEVHKFVRDENK